MHFHVSSEIPLLCEKKHRLSVICVSKTTLLLPSGPPLTDPHLSKIWPKLAIELQGYSTDYG